jgi:hypothetical protein
MPLSDLNKDDMDVVAQCLRASVYGTFFDDIEFQSLFGVSRAEAKVVADQFPGVDEFDDSADGNDDAWLVINNAFLNVLARFNDKEPSWQKFIAVSPQRVKQVYEKWR